MTPGTRLGPYEIAAAIGAGGMGEVYRATDGNLKRSVAIKVLPASVATDADRLARFQREAEVLAALNHPNIAAIYGLEKTPDFTALVMELVEGEDLSAHIARGAMPLAEALPIARQIADALEAAHEAGVVHRDLKPVKIKVRADGTVKVLDFGLAKARAPEGAGATADPLNSPTMTSPAMTAMGMILGTAAYMAPEQAKGRPVDRRADIWAFGVVLLEMLTGRRAFGRSTHRQAQGRPERSRGATSSGQAGDDVSDVLVSVLRDAPDFTALPAETPPSVRRLLRRCLEKDPKKRLSAIGDARLELDEPGGASAATATTAPARPPLASRLWPALLVLLLTVGTAALLWPRSGTAADDTRVERLSLLPPPGVSLYPDSAGVVISPDGSRVVLTTGGTGFAGTEGGGLWVRDLDSLETRALGIDGGSLPFWSPDGLHIGYFSADGKLNTIAVTGGKPDVLCPAAAGRGATWSSSGVIVFAPDPSGPLYQVPAGGGTPTPATKLDAGRKQAGHRMPTMLPDGDHFLYAALPSRNGQFDIFAGSLSDRDTAVFVGAMESAPVYAPSAGAGRGDPGWLFYARQGVLMAQEFDAKALKLQGTAVRLGDEPKVIMESRNSLTAGRVTSASSTGVLAYVTYPSNNTQAVIVNGLGQVTGALDLPPGHYESLRIAPDGKRAVAVKSMSPAESQLWLVDLARGGAVPFTSGPGRHDDPVWSPDGAQIVFAANADGPMHLYVKNVDDGSQPKPLYQTDLLFTNAVSWSADGRWIVVNQINAGTSQDIWLLPMPGAGPMTPFVRSPGIDGGGNPSPDGRWVEYVSNETGRMQVYVRSFSEPGRPIQVSRDGVYGFGWWSRDGRQIVFADLQSRTLWAVDVQPGPSLKVSAPRTIATLPQVIFMDAMPDRRSFVAIVPERPGTGSVTVVRNWRAALDGKAGK